MIVLRLSNSDDLNEAVPPDERVGNVAGRTMSEEIGQPVETITRAIWATDDLPDRIERWLDQYQPDFVFMKVNWYWYGYESVPLRVERLLGRRLGRPLARLGIRAAESPTVGSSKVFKHLRRYAHRFIGGDSPFTTDHVISVMDASIRRIVAREHTVLLVKGTGGRRAGRGDPATWYFADALARKVDTVEGAIRRRCDELHVAWVDTETQGRIAQKDRDLARGDGIHRGLKGHQILGMTEGRSMAKAWREANAEPA